METLRRFASWVREQNLLPGKTVSLQRAENVARIISTTNDIEQIYLFGSVARYGEGKDMDMAVIVREDLAEEFLEEMKMIRSSHGDKDSYDLSFARLCFATHLLGLDPTGDIYTAMYGITYKKLLETKEWREGGSWILRHSRSLDIFLLPWNWQTNYLTNQLLPTKDPNFLRNIKKDMLLFDATTGHFKGIGFLRRNFGKYIYRISQALKSFPRKARYWLWHQCFFTGRRLSRFFNNVKTKFGSRSIA